MLQSDGPISAESLMTKTFDEALLNRLARDDVDLSADVDSRAVLEGLIDLVGSDRVQRALRELDAMRELWKSYEFEVGTKKELLPKDLLEPALLIRSYTMPDFYSHVSTFLNDPEKRIAPQEQEKYDKASHWIMELKRSCLKIALRWPEWKVDAETLYRGMKFRWADITEAFPQGKVVPFYTVKSASTEKEVMKDDKFAGLSGDRTVLQIKNYTGLDLSRISAVPHEAEVLLFPGSFFKVVDSRKGSCVDGRDPIDVADTVVLEYLGSWKKGTVLVIGGRPGQGKSALLNAMCGENLFRSGLGGANLGGRTFQLDRKPHAGRMYADTPGLDDSSGAQTATGRPSSEGDTKPLAGPDLAANAIWMALRAGGDFQIFFVMTANENRASSLDLLLMRAVCEACRDLPTFKFTVVVNRCSDAYLKNEKAKDDFEKGYRALLNDEGTDGSSACSGFIFLPTVPDMESKEDGVWRLRNEDRHKLSVAPSTHVDPSKLSEVSVRNFEVTIGKLEEKIGNLEKMKKRRTVAAAGFFWLCVIALLVIAWGLCRWRADQAHHIRTFDTLTEKEAILNDMSTELEQARHFEQALNDTNVRLNEEKAKLNEDKIKLSEEKVNLIETVANYTARDFEKEERIRKLRIMLKKAREAGTGLANQSKEVEDFLNDLPLVTVNVAAMQAEKDQAAREVQKAKTDQEEAKGKRKESWRRVRRPWKNLGWSDRRVRNQTEVTGKIVGGRS